MRKVLAKLLVALIIGVYAVNAITPIVTPAYAAAEQKSGDNDQQQGDDKKNEGGHSGHH